MPRYTDEFRAGTVLLLEGAGYPDKKGALAEVAANVGVPAMTISRWFRAAQNPPPNEMVTEKRLALIEVIRNEIYAVAGDFTDTRQDADYKTLVTAFAIMVDKLQLLEGKATERKELTGKNGAAIQTELTVLSELSDEDLERIISGKPPASEGRTG